MELLLGLKRYGRESLCSGTFVNWRSIRLMIALVKNVKTRCLDGGRCGSLLRSDVTRIDCRAWLCSNRLSQDSLIQTCGAEGLLP